MTWRPLSVTAKLFAEVVVEPVAVWMPLEPTISPVLVSNTEAAVCTVPRALVTWTPPRTSSLRVSSL